MTDAGELERKYAEGYRRKSLAELERQYRGLTQRGIPDSERELGLLEAQIVGLLEHRPEGFGARVERLRDQAEKLNWSLEQSRLMRAALELVIAEKQDEQERG